MVAILNPNRLENQIVKIIHMMNMAHRETIKIIEVTEVLQFHGVNLKPTNTMTREERGKSLKIPNQAIITPEEISTTIIIHITTNMETMDSLRQRTTDNQKSHLECPRGLQTHDPQLQHQDQGGLNPLMLDNNYGMDPFENMTQFSVVRKLKF